jgi:hypothetical protein
VPAALTGELSGGERFGSQVQVDVGLQEAGAARKRLHGDGNHFKGCLDALRAEVELRAIVG